MKSFLTPDRFVPKTLQDVADYLQFSHILKSLDQQQAKEKQQIVLDAQKEIDWLKESLNQVVLMMITPELEAAKVERDFAIAAARTNDKAAKQFESELVAMTSDRDSQQRICIRIMAELEAAKAELVRVSKNLNEQLDAETAECLRMREIAHGFEAERDALQSEVERLSKFAETQSDNIVRHMHSISELNNAKFELWKEMRDALIKIATSTQQAYDYDRIGSGEFEDKYPEWRELDPDMFMAAAIQANETARAALKAQP